MKLLRHNMKSLLKIVNREILPKPHRSACERPWRYYIAEWTRSHAKIHPLNRKESQNGQVAA